MFCFTKCDAILYIAHKRALLYQRSSELVAGKANKIPTSVWEPISPGDFQKYFPSFFSFLSLSLKSKVHSSLFRCSVWKIGVSEYRGSAAGFLIAAERKSRLERRRLTVPGIEPVNHWLYMGRRLQTARCQSHVNCWQHSFLEARPARIIHIFTGSQINSPRAHPEARILKPGMSFGQLEFKQNHVRLLPIWCSGWPAPQKPRAIKLPFIYALVRPLNPIYSSVRPNQRSQKAALVNNWAAACSLLSQSAQNSV